MPVRIYDLAKKLGLESKEVLAKAKTLGIAAAKVPSSSLDKITAEYLEEQLGGKKIAPPPPPPPPPEAIVIVKAPEPPPPSAPETVPVLPPPSPALHVEAKAEPLDAVPTVVEGQLTPSTVEPAVPPPPPQPVGPQIGDKIGSIKLPTKPAPRPAEKPGAFRPPPRPGMPGRPEQIGRAHV